jgi:hypothetical protein
MAGKLRYTPATNAVGTDYCTLKYQVQDPVGTNSAGPNTDLPPWTIVINVARVNHAPHGTSKTLNLFNKSTYTLTAADFGFSDPKDRPANTLLAVKITALPRTGRLTDNGVAVRAGQFISVDDINSGKLRYTPATSGFGLSRASFNFRVQDNGGTEFGGVNLDPVSRTLTTNSWFAFRR